MADGDQRVADRRRARLLRAPCDGLGERARASTERSRRRTTRDQRARRSCCRSQGCDWRTHHRHRTQLCSAWRDGLYRNRQPRRLATNNEHQGRRMTKLIIIHGGQTGVDRGAHFAARDTGLAIEGFMPLEENDELGPIPPDVAKWLTPMKVSGFMQRTVQNVIKCDAVLAVVEDKQKPWATRGTALALQTARLAAQRPRLAIDEGDKERFVIDWIRGLMSSNARAGEFRLMVCGPRASLWPSGERVAD